MSDLSTSLEALLAAAVDRKAAPGLSAVAFDRHGVFAQAATGFADVKTKNPLTLDTVVWLASASKLAVSLLTLRAAEKHHFDIDSHEQLVKLVPELCRDWEGSKVYDLFDGKGEEGEWRFRKAPESDKLTVRQMLTHTTGYGYFFNREENVWLNEHTEGGTDLGSMLSLNAPRIWEADKKWNYGMGCDWLAVIIPRITGISLRASFHQYLFEPLGIAPDTLDSFRTPAMDAQRGAFAMRTPSDSDTPFIPLSFPFDTPQFEATPPEGKNPLTSAPLWGTLPAFATILQSLLNEEGPLDRSGSPLLSAKMWERARGDALAELGIDIPQRPVFSENLVPVMALGVEWWKKPARVLKEGEDSKLGWSLLQATVLKEESATGLQPGTITWAGLANTYYFIDRSQGIGAIVTTQFFPWGTQEMLNVRDEVERWTVANNLKRAG